MAEPYKAYKDNGLFKLLNSLNRASIHPQHIETDGSLLVKISSYYDLDIVADCYINEDGQPYQGTPDMPATDYWAPHEANARRALVNLLQLLCLAPDNAKIQIS